VNCVVVCIVFLCRSVYCLCVNVYYTTATGWLSNCSLQLYNDDDDDDDDDDDVISTSNKEQSMIFIFIRKEYNT